MGVGGVMGVYLQRETAYFVQYRVCMGRRLLHFVFFANYFVGFLAVALSIETAFQLSIPLCPFFYYVLLFASTVLFYTSAYVGPVNSISQVNRRTEWYRVHKVFVVRSQAVWLAVCVLLGGYYVVRCVGLAGEVGLVQWLVLGSVPVAALLYYGWVPKLFSRFNLRNTGWLKAFVIGYVWAGFVGFLPVVAATVFYGLPVHAWWLVVWLFVKNWMFCTVNAIMFDMKDYVDDSNRQLKTFVVRMGVRKTIFYVLIPLVLVGIVSLLFFACQRGFGALPVVFNLLPFVCLLWLAYSLYRRRSILYYLVVIDGLLLVKALCGIAGMLFVRG